MTEKWCWTCGHEAEAHCAECHQLLAAKSTVLVEIIDTLLDALRENGPSEVADAAGARLTATLNATIQSEIPSEE